MSYLSQSLRLHFAGQFQATVSTVNNDVTHFNNDTFQPNYQLRQDPSASNGWWNPAGDGVWRLLGCAITSAFMADGSSVLGSDPILSFSIADSDDSAPAKIVDLDPQQQMVSSLFGLKIRIADAHGNTLMKGNFAPAAFTELWNKVWSKAGGDAAYGAMWQSVITVSEWGDVSGSTFLSDLKTAADANADLLSIKFNVDLYSMEWPTPGQSGGENFCRGRIVGTLGPASAEEPQRFVTGRQLYPTLVGGGAVVNFCAAVVDCQRQVIRLDLGNALPVTGSGSIFPLGDIFLQFNLNGRAVTLGQVPESLYTDPSWYQRTAGLIEFPLAAKYAAQVAENPLQIALGSASAPALATEMADGLYVRADLFVFRISEDQSAPVQFFATKFGQAYPNASIVFFDSPAQLQGTPAPVGTLPGTLQNGEPYLCAPAAGLIYPTSIITNLAGQAQTTLIGGDTQNFRGYIDGQIYGIGYGLADQQYQVGSGPLQSLNNTDGLLANPWNFLSVLVFDPFIADEPPTWYGSIEPIFQQYANLYPVMARFIDLGNYQQVIGYANMLKHAFSLAEEDPNAMPVTRDLSPAKRQAILSWLDNPLAGTPPPQPPTTPPGLSPVSLAAAPSEFPICLQGGKAAAMARRFCNR